MVNIRDLNRNAFMLKGALSECGYDWWWHSFTGRHSVTGEEKAFFIEFFTCNPALGGAQPILGQLPDNQRQDRKPSYLMGHGVRMPYSSTGFSAGTAYLFLTVPHSAWKQATVF